MREMLRWIVGKVIDAWIGVVGSVALGCAYWLVFSPLSPWGGWRAIGIALSLSVAFFAVTTIYREVNGKSGNSRREKKEMERQLANLDPAESRIVHSFQESQKNTQSFDKDLDTIAGLLAKGVIVLASQESRYPFLPMMLSPVAREVLRDNPQPKVPKDIPPPTHS